MKVSFEFQKRNCRVARVNKRLSLQRFLLLIEWLFVKGIKNFVKFNFNEEKDHAESFDYNIRNIHVHSPLSLWLVANSCHFT